MFNLQFSPSQINYFAEQFVSESKKALLTSQSPIEFRCYCDNLADIVAARNRIPNTDSVCNIFCHTTTVR